MSNLRTSVCALVTAAIVGACGTTVAPPSADPAPSGDPAPSAGLDLGGDVTTYRGDAARTGVMPGPGPTGTPQLAWQFQAGAPIGSSPAVVGTTAYVPSNDGMLRALDLRTGTVSWTVPLGATTGSASPLVVDGSVVVADQSGKVHALDPATGAEHWSFQADGPIDGAAASVGDTVLTATEVGTAYALDARTGGVRWRTGLPAGVTRSVSASRDTLFVGAGGILVALRLSDGAILWQSSVASSGDCGTPTVAGGLAFDATGIDGDALDAKGVVAVDAATGTVRWRFASPTHDQAYTPAVSAGRGYIVSEDGTVVALDAATGAVAWTAKTGAPNEALATVSGGIVYVPTNGQTLVALDAATGSIQWRAPIRGVPYAPVVAHGMVLVGTNVGALYAFGSAAK
ncbi:MAG TPA: PQQ-binding-like beta-propeller repeat protein [Candidatus Dormibacteraeota bacterium]|nr:PQQ-binding-like beta-propeller repeat protein [Candidatus Dormibacteraeota bacterium]